MRAEGTFGNNRQHFINCICWQMEDHSWVQCRQQEFPCSISFIGQKLQQHISFTQNHHKCCFRSKPVCSLFPQDAEFSNISLGGLHDCRLNPLLLKRKSCKIKSEDKSKMQDWSMDAWTTIAQDLQDNTQLPPWEVLPTVKESSAWTDHHCIEVWLNFGSSKWQYRFIISMQHTTRNLKDLQRTSGQNLKDILATLLVAALGTIGYIADGQQHIMQCRGHWLTEVVTLLPAVASRRRKAMELPAAPSRVPSGRDRQLFLQDMWDAHRTMQPEQLEPAWPNAVGPPAFSWLGLQGGTTA